MIEVLIGILSGFVSRYGNGRRNNFDFMTFHVYVSRTTYCTSNQFSIFYTDLTYCNYNKYKTKKYRF